MYSGCADDPQRVFSFNHMGRNDYITATGIVMLFGFIAGWFYKSNFWMAFIYVGIVLVLAYFVDVIKTKKDIEFINTRIRNKK